MLTPILEELSNEAKNEINVVKVNLDENQDLAMKYSIRSIPTLLLFSEGNLIDTKVGLLPKSEIVIIQIQDLVNLEAILFKTSPAKYNEPQITNFPLEYFSL